MWCDPQGSAFAANQVASLMSVVLELFWGPFFFRVPFLASVTRNQALTFQAQQTFFTSSARHANQPLLTKPHGLRPDPFKKLFTWFQTEPFQEILLFVCGINRAPVPVTKHHGLRPNPIKILSDGCPAKTRASSTQNFRFAFLHHSGSGRS